MAHLKNTTTGSTIAVPSRLLIGRGASCSLRLDDRAVSSEHASLAWAGGGWTLRDLGSSNGTFVDGKRIDAGTPTKLTKGATVSFGRSDGGYVLDDDGPPSAEAISVDGGELRRAEDGILALPDGNKPELEVFADSRGGWVLETSDGEQRQAVNGETLTAGSGKWTLILPAPVEGTVAIDQGPRLDSVTLRFAVSRDEEHVQCIVLHRGREIPIESREHWYAILTLARARLNDIEEPVGEQGWRDRDQLLKMLGVDSNGLNVAIYRARRQLTAVGVDGAAEVVEVRRGQRRLGVPTDRIEITSM